MADLTSLPVDQHVAEAKVAWLRSFISDFCPQVKISGQIMIAGHFVDKSLEELEAYVRKKRAES